jgi:ferritin-like metal-binding protein YciE
VAQGPFGKDQLVTWLDDAYAMESGLVSILQNHAGQLDGNNLPVAAHRLRQHIEETRTHAARLQQALAVLGTSPSRIKSMLSSAIGSVEGASTAIFRDHVVKDVLADYASEQFEVACYTALVHAATSLGYAEVADLCQQNLREDLSMAEWLLVEVPTAVGQARL